MTTDTTTREMDRGCTHIFTSRVKNQDGGAYNLTGGKLWFSAKYTMADLDQDAVVQLTSDPGGGITIDNAVQGLITVKIPPSATQFFPDGKTDLVYDIKLRDGIGLEFIAEKGTLSVFPTATRAI